MSRDINQMDIAKGLGILFVIIGHATESELLKTVIYWFHMPLFFFISGRFFRPQKNNALLIKNSQRLLIPYISYFFIISGVVQVLEPHHDFTENLQNFLVGGEKLGYYFGVFWFITCLFFTILLFNNLEKTKNPFILVSILYLFSFIYSTFFQNSIWPGNIQVSAFSVVFFAVGFYSSSSNWLSTSKTASISAIIGSLLIFLESKGIIHYSLDMKYQIYNHLLLDIVVPLSFIILIIKISSLVEGIPIINRLMNIAGQSSLTVMYLHLPLIIISRKFHEFNLIEVTCIALAVSSFIHFLNKRNKLTRILLLGQK
ncbi:acyltransferase family protein [Rossellomorea vietnamensis]|uniref:Acyltransferase family protein n=1 Tax=Rossellomorea vietnamensis TaxID=218284 RepID=A0A5D4MAM2_9BACI|nr:acyltransferase family protein [Rossellomorea vietnamensis]TYR98954.1 acyltransferase family protein [Rossellomorea vietnamensis]